MRTFVLLLPLLLAACGTSLTPASAPDLTGGQTIGELLREPGWTQVAPNYWERPTAYGGTQSIYIGVEGARAALTARRAELAAMTARRAGPSDLDPQLAHLRRGVDRLAAYVASVPVGTVTDQSTRFDCTSAASVQPMTSAPGIKASAWMKCPGNYGPHSDAFASAGAVGTYGTEVWNLSSTSTSASDTKTSPTETCYGDAEAYVEMMFSRMGTRQTGTVCS